ncbi:hypothetical protein X975_00920, partial [Stegodyphus mimosarum]
MSSVSTQIASDSISENAFNKKQCSVEVIGQAAFESIVEIEKNDSNVSNWPDFSEAGSEALLRQLLIADDQVPESSLNKDEPFVYNTAKDYLTSSRENISNAAVRCQNLCVKNAGTSRKTKRTEAAENERNIAHNEKSLNPSDQINQFLVNNISSSSVSFNSVGESTSTDAFHYQNVAIKKEPLSPTTFVGAETESPVLKDQVKNTLVNKDKIIVYSTKEKDCLNGSRENVSPATINFQNLSVKSEDTSKSPYRTKRTGVIEIETNIGRNVKSWNLSDQVKQFPVNNISLPFNSVEQATSTNAFQYQNVAIKQEPLSLNTFVGARVQSAFAKDQVQDTPINKDKTVVYSTKKKDCINNSGGNVSPVAINFQNLCVKNKDTSKRPDITKQAEAMALERNTGHNVKSLNPSYKVKQLPVNNISSSFNNVEESTSTNAFQHQNVVIKKEPLSPSTFLGAEAESAVTKDQVQDTPTNKDKTVVYSTKEKDCLNNSGVNVSSVAINFQNLCVKNKDTSMRPDVTKQAEVIALERNTGCNVKSSNPSDQVKQFPVNNISSSSVSLTSVGEATSGNAFQYQNVAIKQEPLSPNTFIGVGVESTFAKDQVQDTPINKYKTVVYSTKKKRCINNSGENVSSVAINFQNLCVKNKNTSKRQDVMKQAEAIALERNTGYNVKSLNPSDNVKQLPVNNISSSFNSVEEPTSTNAFQYQNVVIKKEPLSPSTFLGAVAEDQVQDTPTNKVKTVVYSTKEKVCINNSAVNVSSVAINFQNLCVKNKDTSRRLDITKQAEAIAIERNTGHNVKSSNPSDQVKQFPVNNISSSSVSLTSVEEATSANAFQYQNVAIKKEPLSPSTFVGAEAESTVVKHEVTDTPINKDKTFVYSTKGKDCINNSGENLSPVATNVQNLCVKNKDMSKRPDITKQAEAIALERNTWHNVKFLNPSDQVKELSANNISSSFNNVEHSTSTNAFQYQNVVIKKEPLSPSTFLGAETESAVAEDQVQDTPTNKDKTFVYSTKEKVCLNSSGENVSPVAINFQNLTVENEDTSKRLDRTKQTEAIEIERDIGHNLKSLNRSDQVKQFPVNKISFSFNNVEESTSTNVSQYQNVVIKKEPLSPSTFVGAEAESVAKDQVQGIPINKDKTVVYSTKEKDCLNSSGENVSPVAINFQNLSVKNDDTSKRPDRTKRAEAIKIERNILHNVEPSNYSNEVKQFSVNSISSPSASFNNVEEATSIDVFQYQNVAVKKEPLSPSTFAEAEAESVIAKYQVQDFHVNKDKTVVYTTEGKICLNNSEENPSPVAISYLDLCLKRKGASVSPILPGLFEIPKTERNIQHNDKSLNPSDEVFILASEFHVNSQAREGNKLNNRNSVDCFNKLSFKDTLEQNSYHMKERKVSGDAELENASTANVVADKYGQEENISKVIENSEKPNEEHGKQCEKSEAPHELTTEGKSNLTLLCDSDQMKITEIPSNNVKASDFCYSNNLFEVSNATTNVKSSCFIDDKLDYDFSSVEKNTFLGYLFDVPEVLKAMEFLENKEHLAMKNLILQDRAIEVEENLSESEEIVHHRHVNFNFKDKLRRDDKHNLTSTELLTAHADPFISSSNEYESSLQPMAEYICDNLKQQALSDECLVAANLCNKKANKRRASVGGTVEESSSKKLCLSTENQTLVKENEYSDDNFSSFANIDVKGVTNSDKDPIDIIPEVCSNENINATIQNRESLEKGNGIVSNSEVSAEELQNNKKITVEEIDKDFLRKILKSVIREELSESHQPTHSLASLSATSISSDHSKEIFSTPELKIDSEAALEVGDSNYIQKLSTTNIFPQNQVEPVQQLNQQPLQSITPVSIVPVHSYQSNGSSFMPISKANNPEGISKVDSNSIQQSSLAINTFQNQGELIVKYYAKRKTELEASQEWKKSKALHNHSFDKESVREKRKYSSQNLSSLAPCHTFKHKTHPEAMSSATSTIYSKNISHDVASYIPTPESNSNNENKSSEMDFVSLAKWPLYDAKHFCGLLMNLDFFNSSSPILARSPAIDIQELQDEQIKAVEAPNGLFVESISINEKQRYNISTGNILLSYSVSSCSRSWDLICFIITWKIDYFLDYDKSKKPPPIAHKCCQVSNIYNSYRCYYETYLPLLLLETWENMYSAWRTLNTKKKIYVWKICAVEIKNRENVISITCDTVTSFSFSEINPKECGVMLLEFISSYKRILGYVHGTWSREYIPEYDKNHPCFQHHRYSDDKCFKRKILIYIAHDNSRWIKKGDLLYISMLTNIGNVLVKNEALVDMRRALLCDTILNPHSCDVKKFELPARLITDTRINDRINDLIKSLNFSTFCLTLVKTSPLFDSIFAIVTMVNCIKAYSSKVLIIARSESTLTEIAHNLNVVVRGRLIILAKEIKDRSLKQCMLDSLIDRSNDDNCQNFLNNCDILLTTLLACQTCDLKKILKHVNIKYCIMNEANMCTELECILPLLYNVPKMIFLGNPTEYHEKCKGVSGIASNLDYYRSFFDR